jgi:hypothetical protein
VSFPACGAPVADIINPVSGTGHQRPQTIERDPVDNRVGTHRSRHAHAHARPSKRWPWLLVVVALAGLAALVTFMVTRPGPELTGPGRSSGSGPVGTDTFLPYTADSFFRSSVQGAPIDRDATAELHTFMAEDRDQAGVRYPVIRGVDGNEWGTPYAEGVAGDPVWRLIGQVPPEARLLRTQGFHAPEWFGDSLTGTSDSPFVVNDMGSGWTVWGSKARRAADHTIRVRNAGFFEHSSNGLDQRNPRSSSDVNFRSRGAIPDATVIRHDLLVQAIARGGDLGHVLHMFFVETDTSAGFVHPMVGEESGKHGFGAEGLRIAIDPDVDLSKRGLSPAGLAIARTLQDYGAYLGDNAGGPSGLKAQQDDDDATLWRNLLHADSLKGITWQDFVVIRPGWQ